MEGEHINKISTRRFASSPPLVCMNMFASAVGRIPRLIADALSGEKSARHSGRRAANEEIQSHWLRWSKANVLCSGAVYQIE